MPVSGGWHLASMPTPTRQWLSQVQLQYLTWTFTSASSLSLLTEKRTELIRWVRSIPRPPMRISVQIEQETQRLAGWTLTTYSDPNGKPKTGRLDLTLHTPRPEQETQRPTGWTSTTTPTWTGPDGLVPLLTPKSAGCQSLLWMLWLFQPGSFPIGNQAHHLSRIFGFHDFSPA